MAVRSRYAPAVILSGSTTPAVAGRSLNEAALALSRSLGRRGVRVVRFHPDRSLADLRSRYCTHQLCADLDESPDALVAELVKFARRESSMPVLFPASEAASRFVAGHERFLQPYFRLTSPPEECLERVQDRRRLIELARQASIGVPDTYFPESIEDVLRIAEEIDYPVIVRPLRSGGRRSAFARQVRATRVDSARELSVIARMFSAAEPVVVQELVDGPDQSLLTFIGYVGRSGRALAGCVRRRLRQWPSPCGRCTLTETVDDPEIRDLAITLLHAAGYRGIAAVEFKRDACGSPTLLDVDTLAGPTTALAAASGADIPWIAYMDTVGYERSAFAYDTHVRWVHVHHELAAARSLVSHGRLSWRDWLGDFRGKRVVTAEFSWDDMRPALSYWASRNIVRALRGLQRLRRPLDPRAASPESATPHIERAS